MNTSSSEAVQEGNKAIREDTIPEWLDNFLEKTFFEKCPIHDLIKNDLNRYCITCDKSICKYCVTLGHHGEHKLLTIYRHVYQDVVPLSEMESHINCANIQHFKCNKKWVVSLIPLPHNGSGSSIEGDGACTICKRKLTDHGRSRFCSIACKFQAITGKVRRVQHRAHEASTSQGGNEIEQPANKSYRRRSRKGVPHRAPFF